VDLASSRQDGKKTAVSICDWLPEEITLSQTPSHERRRSWPGRPWQLFARHSPSPTPECHGKRSASGIFRRNRQQNSASTLISATGKLGNSIEKGQLSPRSSICESDIVQSDFPGSVCRKIKVLNDLGALDGYDHAPEGGATVVPRRELRVCDRRILAAKRTQSIDSPGLAN